MPVGTPFHDRTFPLCESLSYREWAGYYAPSSYEPLHEHEYNAIRNAAALIDVSPLFKYDIGGRDAAALVNRIITRDAERMKPGQVIYTPWCDEHGRVLDDGLVMRSSENQFHWTAAEPNLRWIRQNAAGLDVQIDDVSERVAALSIQGPTSSAVLRQVVEADIDGLKYFHITEGQIEGRDVEITRTGYTGDLGYEIWMTRNDAGARLGCPHARWPLLWHSADRVARARRCANRSRTAADGRGLLQRAQGAHDVAVLHAVRNGIRPPCGHAQARFRRSRGAR
jgi:aminomethyltransferase